MESADARGKGRGKWLTKEEGGAEGKMTGWVCKRSTWRRREGGRKGRLRREILVEGEGEREREKKN